MGAPPNSPATSGETVVTQAADPFQHHRLIDPPPCEDYRGAHEGPMIAALIPSQPASTSPYDDGLAAFMRVRPRLFGIVYRILGSAAEAEDIVQDVWLRWQTTD